jgi:16S rRNA (guanine1516-N2)-methyltransferase
MQGPSDIPPAPLTVVAAASALAARAAELAAKLGLPLIPPERTEPTAELLLIVDRDGLSLRENQPRGAIVHVDFRSGGSDHRRRHGGGLGQLIARAVGVGADFPSVVDATAGLGQDAFVLASLGCRVTAVERSAVLTAMIEDALAAATARGSLEVCVEKGVWLRRERGSRSREGRIRRCLTPFSTD